MSQPTMKIERMSEGVEVYLEGELIAETQNAIKLHETNQEPVIYIPKNDLKEIDLIKCGEYDSPHKGHAEMYIVKHGARDFENAAWSYDEPLATVPELRGRVAFYPDKVQEIRIVP